MTSSVPDSGSILDRVIFRQVIPADIPACFEIERASYPADEAASKSSLQYRQHFAEKFFRCAVLLSDNDDEKDDIIIGFVCATRCRSFTEECMSTHDPSGPLLAVHSVVVAEPYRRMGIATAMMKDYIEKIPDFNGAVERFVLLAKAHLLSFYVKCCGFSVLKPSDIVHGKELWYHLERAIENKSASRLSWVVDSFTGEPGKGNPAGVVLLEENPEKRREWCQTVAREFNHSETAFVWKLNEATEEAEENGKSAPKGRTRYGIRYFTSNGTEVDLCGHATLAAAAVLFLRILPHTSNNCKKKTEELVFCAKHDELVMKPFKYWSGKKMQISMDFPVKTLTELDKESEDVSEVVKMLQLAFPSIKDRISPSNIVYVGLDQDGNDLLVELPPDVFEAIGYDSDIHIDEFNSWAGYQRGVIVCCATNSSCNNGSPTNESSPNSVDIVDFTSRFFAPKVGIPEDPVTGSAHCTLTPYFAKKMNKTMLKAQQKSKRGGAIQCTLLAEENRVTLTGPAVITLCGNCWI